MIKRLLLTILGLLFLYLSLFIFLFLFNLVVFVIHVDNFPGEAIELDGETRYISDKDGFILVIKKIEYDSEIVLNCRNYIDRDGYITPRLHQLIYIEVKYCDIMKFQGYNVVPSFLDMF